MDKTGDYRSGTYATGWLGAVVVSGLSGRYYATGFLRDMGKGGTVVSRSLVTEDELRALYVDRGLSTGEIGKMFGISRQAVSYRLRAAGIEARSSVGVEISEDRLRALYVDAGLSARAIALIYDTYPQRVLDLCVEYGIDIRPGQPRSERGPKEVQSSVSCSERVRVEWETLAEHFDESLNQVFADAVHHLFLDAFTARGIMRSNIEQYIRGYHLEHTGVNECPVCGHEGFGHESGCPLGQLVELGGE